MADIDKIKVGSTTYNVKDSTAYHTGDSAETTVADDDLSPFYDTSATATKKITFANLWTWIKGKLGIASSGSTYLKKDGTWGTPTNTTYTLGTSGNNVTLTPSSGTAQSVTVPYATSAGSATDNTKLPLAGGDMTGHINFPAGKGVYSKHSTGEKYALITDNGNNLWIGAQSSTYHHHSGTTGKTFISSGYNTTNNAGNPTIIVSVPKLTNDTWTVNNYDALHTGNTSYIQSLSSGTTIGTIKINGTETTIYAPTNTDTKVRQTLSTTNKNYPLLMSYAENSSTTSNIDNISYRANAIYANPSTGTLTVPNLGIQAITVKTGDTAQSKITLDTLMTWLITTKKYIPSGVNCHVVLTVGWSYANNDILQLTAANPNGTSTNYELQLAGTIIEFIGNATNYNTGIFRLRIHSSPVTSFTPTSGYTKFPVNHIAEYSCNGSTYSPAWRLILEGGDLGSYLLKSGGTMTGRLTTSKPINQIITGGSGEVGSTSSGVYKPTTWKFDLSWANPTHGDIITIEPPVNGHANGVWLSFDNGTTYYPCSVNNGTTRLQTQFPADSLCMLQFDSNASTTIYPVAGGTATTSVTGGAWRVVNFYNSTYNFSGTTFYSGNSGNSEHNANNIQNNGHFYYTSNGPSTSLGAQASDGAIYAQAYSASYVGQIAQDYRNGNLFVRGKNNGTWTDWKAIQTKWILAGTATSMIHGTATPLICTIPSTCEEVRIEAVVTGFYQKMFLSKSVLVTTLLGCLPQVNDAFVITMTMDSKESTYDEDQPQTGNSRVSVAVGIKRVSSGFEFRKVFGTRSEAAEYFEDLEMYEFIGNANPTIYFYYR
ncbi:MAG: hypothetical protein J6U54_09635 [Clostridiales bacterium]|nr:hypothetical protein [Clostridiales bacterium]